MVQSRHKSIFVSFSDESIIAGITRRIGCSEKLTKIDCTRKSKTKIDSNSKSIKIEFGQNYKKADFFLEVNIVVKN